VTLHVSMLGVGPPGLLVRGLYVLSLDGHTGGQLDNILLLGANFGVRFSVPAVGHHVARFEGLQVLDGKGLLLLRVVGSTG